MTTTIRQRESLTHPETLADAAKAGTSLGNMEGHPITIYIVSGDYLVHVEGAKVFETSCDNMLGEFLEHYRKAYVNEGDDDHNFEGIANAQSRIGL